MAWGGKIYTLPKGNPDKPTWLSPGKRYIMPDSEQGNVVGYDRDQRGIQGQKILWLIVIAILMLIGLFIGIYYYGNRNEQTVPTTVNAVHNTQTLVTTATLGWGDCPLASSCLALSSIRTVENDLSLPYPPHESHGNMSGYCTNLYLVNSDDFEPGYWGKCQWTLIFDGEHDYPAGSIEIAGMYLINYLYSDDVPYPLTMFSVQGGTGNYSQVIGGSVMFLPRFTEVITMTIHLDWVNTM